MQSCEMLLTDFLHSNIRNTWIMHDDIQVYVRKSKRLINGELVTTFDVANVGVYPHAKGTGVFKSAMLHIETFGMVVFVESVINASLATQLQKHGYLPIDNGNSFYKVTL
jgi:hypothetical protein